MIVMIDLWLFVVQNNYPSNVKRPVRLKPNHCSALMFKTKCG